MVHSLCCVIGSHSVLKVICGPSECAVVIIGFRVIYELDQTTNLVICSAGELAEN